MARTYRTLSLSLHPDVVAKLDDIGRAENITAARVASELVARAVEDVGTIRTRRVERTRAQMIELIKLAKELDVDIPSIVSLYATMATMEARR